MNWFLYIGGWFFGLVAVNTLMPCKDDSVTVMQLCAWTSVWVWVCWRFIA